MLTGSKAEELAIKIYEEKQKLIDEGKRPRLILLGKEAHKELNDGWLETIKELPWGDQLAYELEQRKDKSQLFLADGTYLGLWVVEVDTIEGFKVY